MPETPGPPGLMHQRSDSLGRDFGHVTLQGDLYGRPRGIRIIERHVERSALQIAIARSPSDRGDRQGRVVVVATGWVVLDCSGWADLLVAPGADVHEASSRAATATARRIEAKLAGSTHLHRATVARRP